MPPLPRRPNFLVRRIRAHLCAPWAFAVAFSVPLLWLAVCHPYVLLGGFLLLSGAACVLAFIANTGFRRTLLGALGCVMLILFLGAFSSNHDGDGNQS